MGNLQPGTTDRHIDQAIESDQFPCLNCGHDVSRHYLDDENPDYPVCDHPYCDCPRYV